MNTGTTGGYYRKLKTSKAKLKRQRDNWKTRALAYRDIIKRADNQAKIGRGYAAHDILAEADKLDKEDK